MHGNSIYPPYYGGMPNFSRGLTGISLGMPRGSYLFQKLGSRAFNLSSILTNTQKTLGVINQAIPIVKQAGPMVNNMKTMFKLAGAFKDETDKNTPKKIAFITNNNISNNPSNINANNSNNINNYSYNTSNGPEFFI